MALNIIVRRDYRDNDESNDEVVHFCQKKNLSLCFTYVKSQFKQAMASLALSGACSLLVYFYFLL